ncbi:MAG TPA: hypothetical protein RMH85_35150 [Polyangiaceae bacterium LLY-WYZ-15_(1-7)]|nr:hypothetical protein [Myxococcales bacterium]MAT27332.1 hypothetical protein [Sandaracinus sp.]HJK93851.1 hypothetical protein [Polyangiaceae bacterium LLY-WYZ-15_(1-7)]MBJ74067.1 hypothetical protein [Sandaracinus sp.]HJL06563.1 hypothetical protein [Polyangiaceae bacterium LLY-WYZ-15_(1-7)]
MDLEPAIDAYFASEEAGATLFVAAGVTAIVLALGLLGLARGERRPWRGAAVPLVILGLVELAVGGAVLVTTEAQVANLKTDLEVTPAAALLEERERVEDVIAAFDVYEIVEGFLVFIGLAMAVAARRTAYRAAGLALVAQALTLMALDVRAEGHARTYLAALEAAELPPPDTPLPDPPPEPR